MNEQQKIDKAVALVEEFAKDPDVIALVQRIESGPELTQGHYGKYLALLSSGNKDSRAILSLALISAGANKFGVDSAMRIIG